MKIILCHFRLLDLNPVKNIFQIGRIWSNMLDSSLYPFIKILNEGISNVRKVSIPSAERLELKEVVTSQHKLLWILLDAHLLSDISLQKLCLMNQYDILDVLN